MPGRWEPWPAKRNAVGPVASGTRPRITPASALSRASASRPASSVTRSAPGTAARTGRPAREVASEKAMSSTGVVGFAVAKACRLRACARSPASSRADSGHSDRDGTAGPRVSMALSVTPSEIPSGATSGAGWPGSAAAAGAWSSTGAGTGSGAPGASSMMTCALVPLIPKDDTAARRGSAPAGQATGSVSSRMSPDDQSTCGDGASTCRVRGSSPRRSAPITLITPPMPAAAWVCPMFDFSEPSSSGPRSPRPWP